MTLTDVGIVWVAIGAGFGGFYFLWNNLSIKDEIIINIINNEITKILKEFAAKIQTTNNMAATELNDEIRVVGDDLKEYETTLGSLGTRDRNMAYIIALVILGGISFSLYLIDYTTALGFPTNTLGVICFIFAFLIGWELISQCLKQRKLYRKLLREPTSDLLVIERAKT